MSTNFTINVLKNWGDTLERAICKSASTAEFGLVLYPYSGIWQDHILPRRDPTDLSRLADNFSEWTPFAADHYTALVKTYLAMRCFLKLKECCKVAKCGTLDAINLLDAHEAFSGYWQNLGSAIDNLGRCFDDAPCLNGKHGAGLTSIQGNYQALSTAFDRRTQLIHYPLVPLGYDDGAIVFNQCQFEAGIQKTNWRIAKYSAEWADEFHEQEWLPILSELGAVWSDLRNRLRTNDTHKPQIEPILLDPNKRIHDGDMVHSGSGSGGRPSPTFTIQSTSTRKPSGANVSVPYWIRTEIHSIAGSGTSNVRPSGT